MYRAARELTIEGGALWGNVYRTLVDEGDGIMVNGGRCPSVGVSGFILGGGIGPFSRSYGMGVDNLIEVSIVTADGELYIVRRDDDQDSKKGKYLEMTTPPPNAPKQWGSLIWRTNGGTFADEVLGMLFWALCGAGGGNFGVVVEIKVSTHELSNHGKEVVAGRHTWFPTIDRRRAPILGFIPRRPQPEDPTGLLATMNHFYTTNWPNEMTMDTSWFSDLEVQNGDLAVRFLAYFDGNKHDFNRLIQRGILNADLSKQIQRRALPELSSRFLHETLFAQWDEEAKRSTPANSTFRVYHPFCFKNCPTNIEKITAIVKEELEAFKRLFAGEPAGMCQVSFIHAGGQTTERKSEDTAFRWRETVFHTYIMVQWRDKWLELEMRGFARKFKDRLRQYSISGKAAFINFPDSSMPDTDHLKAYYGNNRDKLQQVKSIWDRNNYWKWDQGIDLAADTSLEAHERADHNLTVNEGELSDGEEDAPEEQTDMAATIRWESRDSTASAPLLTSAFAALGLDYTSQYGWTPMEVESLPPDQDWF